jgi:hypothetical protein
VRWSPEFEAWRRFLEEQVGAEALKVITIFIFEPADRKNFAIIYDPPLN